MKMMIGVYFVVNQKKENNMKSNVDKTLKEMKQCLVDIQTCSDKVKETIKERARICDELMIYSWEVANTESPTWKELEQVVHKILVS